MTARELDVETLAAVRELLDRRRASAPQVRARADAYSFIEDTLQAFDYPRLGRDEKGVLRRFLGEMTGLSRAQITRLLRQYRTTGRLADHRGGPTRPFSRRYSSADIELLAEVDALHGALSGPTTRRLCARAYHLFGDRRFERLAGISNGHLYNLRRSPTYRRRRRVTLPPPTCPVATGGRWRPRPFARPGHLRVVVSRGVVDGFKGMFHLGLVDEATRFQCVVSVERLDAHCLGPVIDSLPGALPFTIRGFHSGDGAEQGKGEVEALLQALLVGRMPQAYRNRSASGRCADDGRAGSRLERLNGFTRQVLSPYLNFHRLRFFPSEYVDVAGRVRKRYGDADVMTPYDRLKSLPGAAGYLTSGVTFEQLDAVATAMNDSEAVHSLVASGVRLFRRR